MGFALSFELKPQLLASVKYQWSFAEQVAVQNHPLIKEILVEVLSVVPSSHQSVSHMGLDSAANS
jgi:hypothetical protein